MRWKSFNETAQKCKQYQPQRNNKNSSKSQTTLKLLFTKVYTCTLKYTSEMKISFYLLLLVIIFSEFEGYGEQQLHTCTT